MGEDVTSDGAQGAARAERAKLEALVKDDRDRVALVARFGSEEAARVLGISIVGPPRVLRLGNLAELNQAFGTWEVGVVYTRAVLRQVLDWWALRGEAYRETVNELRLTLTAVDTWFDERSEEAAEVALAWARAGSARASLVEGRFKQEGRALWHLALALGGLAFVCAPLHAPLRAGDPVGLLVTRFGIRMKRLADIRLEVHESIQGVLYTRHPGLSVEDAAFADAFEAVVRPFEVLAAAEVRRWALGSA